MGGVWGSVGELTGESIIYGFRNMWVQDLRVRGFRDFGFRDWV